MVPLWRRITCRVLFIMAALLLYLSMGQLYWCVLVRAPQYPGGLKLCAYIDRLVGDVRELDNLNHYIGMRPLEEAAQFERRISKAGVALLIGLSFLSALIGSYKVNRFLALPIILYPLVFAGDLYYWLRNFGLNLDPKAPLNHAVKPFIPPLWGKGKIAQFEAIAGFEKGFWLAVGASLLTVVALLILRTRPARASRSVRQQVQVITTGLLIMAFATGIVHAKQYRVEPHMSTDGIQKILDSAANGDTIVFVRGDYTGPFVIRRSIRLIGEQGAVIHGKGKGTVITVLAPNVRIQGLRIRGSGSTLSREHAGILIRAPGAVIQDNRLEDVLFGIYLKNAGEAVIRGNTLIGKPLPMPRRGDLIRTWYSKNVIVEHNRLMHGRDMVLWFSDEIKVRHNFIEGGRYGIHFMYSDRARVESNHISGNSVGSYLMYSKRLYLARNLIVRNRGPSGYGIGLKDMDEVEIRDNIIAGNRVGLFLENSSGIVQNNHIAANDIGVKVFPSARNNLISGNQFIWNGIQVSVEGQGRMDENRWIGNYWSDYMGLDLDHDGFGDEPYAPLHILETLSARKPVLKIFQETPAARALDFAFRLFPIYEPRPVLKDPQPRITPIPIALNVLRLNASPMGQISAFFVLLVGITLIRFIQWPQIRETTDEKATDGLEKGHDVICVQNVSMSYHRHPVLKQVSFTIQQGSCVALWGPNGAGKTTLIRCLLGILPVQGEINIFQKPLRRYGRDLRRHIGYVPQDVRFNPNMTVKETLHFYSCLRKVPLDDPVGYLSQFQLDRAMNQRIGELSGGQRQKLALAVALLGDPPLLFLDEPTSNLDPEARHEFLSILKKLKAKNITILFCTHRSFEVFGLADRVMVLREGILEQDVDFNQLNEKRPCLIAAIFNSEQTAQAVYQEAEQSGFKGQVNGKEIEWLIPPGRKIDLLAWLIARKEQLRDVQVLNGTEVG